MLCCSLKEKSSKIPFSIEDSTLVLSRERRLRRGKQRVRIVGSECQKSYICCFWMVVHGNSLPSRPPARMSDDRVADGDHPSTSAKRQPKLLPPLRKASLHHRQHENGTWNESDENGKSPMPSTSRPSLPATATAAAVAVRLGRNHGPFVRQPQSKENGMGAASDRRFRPKAARGGIYAATTAVQQDIVRLERDLRKVLMAAQSRQRQTSLGRNGSADQLAASRKSIFMRSAVPGHVAEAINEDIRADGTQFGSIANDILNTLERHKLATQLPFCGDVLGVLSIPFDHIPLNCKREILQFGCMTKRLNRKLIFHISGRLSPIARYF